MRTLDGYTLNSVKGQILTIRFKAFLNVFKRGFAGVKLVFFEAFSGRIPVKTLILKGLKRKYRFYIPSFYSKFKKLPLIFVLHGRGANGASMLLLTRKGFNKLAERDGFIVIYPDGIEMNWNDGRKDEKSNDRAHRENIDDVGFISALIDVMKRDYNIDPGRVYVTGISNGAIMAYRLAIELSHKITAIAPVNGNIPQQLFPECVPYLPVSVLAINNTDDPMVPFDGGEIQGSFKGVKLGKVLSVKESIGFWVNRNNCSDVPDVEEIPDKDPSDGTTAVRKRYRSEASGTEVILYEIKGGGHTWPGGVQYLPASIIGRTCRDFDANEVIWSFFRNISRSMLNGEDA
jgi:polyhydroxybutyrate depolymerase